MKLVQYTEPITTVYYVLNGTHKHSMLSVEWNPDLLFAFLCKGVINTITIMK